MQHAPTADGGSYVVNHSHPAVAQNERVRFLVIGYTGTASDEASLRVMSTDGAVPAEHSGKADAQTEAIALALVEKYRS